MTQARFSGTTSVSSSRHLFDSSKELCGGVADIADTIQGILGPIENTSIVISDNLDGLRNRLFQTLMREGSLADAVSQDALKTLPPNFRPRQATEGFLWLQNKDEHAVIGLRRKHARAIADPHSPRHIQSVATLAHELGHVRAIRAGHDLKRAQRDFSRKLPEDIIAEHSISEYLAVRAEVDVVDKLYGGGFDKRRSSAFAKFHTKKISDLSSRMDRIRSAKPHEHADFLSNVGYNIGTLNGYLDGFRATGKRAGLPFRTDQLEGLDAQSAMVLNITRGGLVNLHRSLLNSGSPEPLLRRAAVQHGHAIEKAISATPRERAPRRAERGIERS